MEQSIVKIDLIFKKLKILNYYYVGVWLFGVMNMQIE